MRLHGLQCCPARLGDDKAPDRLARQRGRFDDDRLVGVGNARNETPAFGESF